MEPIEFLNIAREKISNDPKKRLSGTVKTLIENPNCVYDIHTHVFDKKCLSITFFLLRILKSKIFENIQIENFDENCLLSKNEEELYAIIENREFNSEIGWIKLEEELNELIEITDNIENFGSDLRKVLHVLKKNSMIEVLDFYLNSLSINNLAKYKNSPLVSVALMMDLETAWGIKPVKNLSDQVIEMKLLSKERNVLPFLPLDPRRCSSQKTNENLYELFLDAFADHEFPFFGVKCYPALGYLPTDSRLDPIFEICSEKNIPLMTHCGGEIVSTFQNSFVFHSNSKIKCFQNPFKTRTEFARYLNDPAHWEPVLNKYPKLKLCFAHFGGVSNWEKYNSNFGNERINMIIQMMQNSDWNVFTDFSFNVIDQHVFKSLYNVLNNNLNITNKVMFGTDYWVVLPSGDLCSRQLEFLTQLSKFEHTLLNIAPTNYLFS